MRPTLVLDTGAAHTESLRAALERAGLPAQVTQSPVDVRAAERLVIADFDDDERALSRGIAADIVAAIHQHVSEKKPLLAVGRALVLLLRGGAAPTMPAGLEVFGAPVQRFDPRMADENERPLKSPHVGYSLVVGLDRHPQLRRVVPAGKPGVWVYFCHRLCAPARVPFADVAVAHHGVPFAGAIWRERTLAVQFRPELSGQVGVDVLRAWGET